MPGETIIHNAKIATDGVPSFVEAIAISGWGLPCSAPRPAAG
jgi:hypothetical protein